MLMAFVLVLGGCAKNPAGARFFPAKLNEADDWGMADVNGNMIVSDMWEEAPSTETEGIVYVADKDGLYEYFRVGKSPQKLGGKYFEASNFSEGLAAVVTGKDDARYIQYIDRSGKVKFDLKQLGGKRIISASSFKEGRAWVLNEDDKYGFIDKTGKELVKCKYDDALEFSEGLALVGMGPLENRKYGFIDKQGKLAIELISGREYYNFSGGYSWFWEEGEDVYKHGTIDKKGRIYISPSEDIEDAENFLNGVAVFNDGEYFGLINARGKEIVPAKYEWMSQVPAGIMFAKGEKMGVMNCKGKEIVPATDDYDALAPIGKNRLIVLKGGKIRVVDMKGKPVSQNKFEQFDFSGAMGDAVSSMVSISYGYDTSDWASNGFNEDLYL